MQKENATLIDRDSAAASLLEIEVVQKRTREALAYAGSSLNLVVWGVLVAIGHLLAQFQIDQQFWLPIRAIGIVATIVICFAKARSRTGPRDRRVLYSILILAAFGMYWSMLLGPGHGREVSAFWPTLFMSGLAVMGLWIGRFFTLFGLGVTALTIIGYLWLGEWFHLWQAVVGGGGLIAGGLWLRRIA